MHYVKLLLLVSITSLCISCSQDPVEQAYQNCMSKIKQSSEDIKAQVDTSGNDDTGKKIAAGVAQGISSMVEGIGQASCTAIKEACKNDRQSTLCKTIVAQYRDL